MADERTEAPQVPILLTTVAAWAWRLIVVGALVYVLLQMFDQVRIVALPTVIAVLMTSLLHPVTDRLRKWGAPSLLATWLTLLLALSLIAGVGVLIGLRANSDFPKLLTEIQSTARSVQTWLETGPLHLKHAQLEDEINKLAAHLRNQQTQLVNTALSATAKVGEFLAGIIFMFFVMFFLLKDGRKIWAFMISGTGSYQPRLERAGRAGWQTLSHYVQGSVMVSAIHAIAIAIVLTVMGVPLVVPLAVLVFFSSFIPIVGILFAGGLACLVVFSAKGIVAGLVFLGILLLEQQLEGHLLQPMVVGRRLHFHPLAIILILGVGGVVGGIPGAALAIPLSAVAYRAWPALRGNDVEPEEEPPPAPAT